VRRRRKIYSDVPARRNPDPLPAGLAKEA